MLTETSRTIPTVSPLLSWLWSKRLCFACPRTSGSDSPALIFTDLTGTASLREGFVFYRDSGMFVQLVSDLVPGETVQFQSAVFSVEIESSIDKTYSNLIDGLFRLRAVAAQDTSMNTPASAGQWLRLDE